MQEIDSKELAAHAVSTGLANYDKAIGAYETNGGGTTLRTNLQWDRAIAEDIVEAFGSPQDAKQLSVLHTRYGSATDGRASLSADQGKKRRRHVIDKDWELDDERADMVQRHIKASRTSLENDRARKANSGMPKEDAAPSEWMPFHWDKAEAWLELQADGANYLSQRKKAFECVLAWPIDPEDTAEVSQAKLEAFKTLIWPYRFLANDIIDKFRDHADYIDYLFTDYARRVGPRDFMLKSPVLSMDDFALWRRLCDLGTMSRNKFVCDCVLGDMVVDESDDPTVVEQYRDVARHALRWAAGGDGDTILDDEELVKRAVVGNFVDGNGASSSVIKNAIAIGLLEPVPPVEDKPFHYNDHYFRYRWQARKAFRDAKKKENQV
ncbi:hypothetical protein ml_124 [Mollivirus sibericum]|uniref:hypothetical protein n=1 Tax=Mollivirus sibericum TaxID=1678078 RepID=UPI0006B2E02F|nr:hypothetical protein ml_124 [Mollivirus sibericum]ALD61926.1 hypothetical protein ml_124 [Mollivirus sibericum]